MAQYAPAHPAAYAPEVYADEAPVYAYQYGVSDDYSGAQFNQQVRRIKIDTQVTSYYKNVFYSISCMPIFCFYITVLLKNYRFSPSYI